MRCDLNPPSLPPNVVVFPTLLHVVTIPSFIELLLLLQLMPDLSSLFTKSVCSSSEYVERADVMLLSCTKIPSEIRQMCSSGIAHRVHYYYPKTQY